MERYCPFAARTAPTRTAWLTVYRRGVARIDQVTSEASQWEIGNIILAEQRVLDPAPIDNVCIMGDLPNVLSPQCLLGNMGRGRREDGERNDCDVGRLSQYMKTSRIHDQPWL